MQLDAEFKLWLLKSDPDRPDPYGLDKAVRERLVARLEETELETLNDQLRVAFDPGQPRDEQGQWTTGGHAGHHEPSEQIGRGYPKLFSEQFSGIEVAKPMIGGRQYEIRKGRDSYRMLDPAGRTVATANFSGSQLISLGIERPDDLSDEKRAEVRSEFLRIIKRHATPVEDLVKQHDATLVKDNQLGLLVSKDPKVEQHWKNVGERLDALIQKHGVDWLGELVKQQQALKGASSREEIQQRLALFGGADVNRILGGPGSGNFGHSGRPGEVGGSGSGGSASGGESWKSSGGWEHTGITWRQPTDPKTGRPIPIKVATVEEAVMQVLDGKVIEVSDPYTAYIVIDKLAAIALEAKAKGEDAPTYDLCQISVAGTNMFCAESLRSPEHPLGVPRLEMPQLGGHPEPGSEADKLPKDADGKVNGSQQFITFLQGIGMKTEHDEVPAIRLRASQREIIGHTVGRMVADKTYDPGKDPIFTSNDHYVVDGHHRWAAVIGRDAEDNRLGDSKMKIVRVNAPISEVLHIANVWSKKFGIKQAAGVQSQARKMGLE